MNKYLIFRTDRIGDFLLSLILIQSIKKLDKNSHITVVASEKNYEFIKSFSTIDEVLLYKKGIFEKFYLFSFLRKFNFDNIIVHDAKRRSKLISLFLKCNKKYISGDIKFSYYIDEIIYILKFYNLKFNENLLNTLENRNYSKFAVPNKPYIIIHFDEKWIYNKYIKSYKNIEPNLNQLDIFFNLLLSKINKKIYITTGVNTPYILTKYFNNKYNSNITLLENLNFLQLEACINNTSLLISCHGAISHIAAAKNIDQIDIVDESYNYTKWTKHFRKYRSIKRNNFDILCKEIIKLF